MAARSPRPGPRQRPRRRHGTGDRVRRHRPRRPADLPRTTFSTQAQGRDVVVAELKRRFPKAEKTITTSGFPEIDGAPGGTLRSYGILADTLKKLGAEVDLRHEHVCFVPSVSAVSIRDLDQQKDLYADIDDLNPDESDVDDFICSSANTGHTVATEELCTWLLDRLPD